MASSQGEDVQQLSNVDSLSPSESRAQDEHSIGIEKVETLSSRSLDDQYSLLDGDDRDQLYRLATDLSRKHTASSASQALQRRDTLTGLELGDPVLDPNHASFDLHTYLRYTFSILKQEDIKISRLGIAMKDVIVRGTSAGLQLQGTLGSALSSPLRIAEHLRSGRKEPKPILRDFNALLKSGELLIVLGRPGAGCSTFLKTITGDLHGLQLDKDSIVEYNGLSQHQMLKEFAGELVYNQEVDKHFPHLTVGETLEHAAALRTPAHRPMGISRDEFVTHITQVVMAIFGLTHTYSTKVGNDFVRGVSGGERKRVSIAEMALAGSAIAAWDNSTRGLDSATALTFVRALRQTASIGGSAHAVAIYQASQAIYDVFDKAVVLYDGREVYFGPADHARAYFERMGWACPQRQTTGDFLTSVTNPGERKAREGYEDQVPRTADEFEAYWKSSPEFATLQREIDDYRREYPSGHADQIQQMREAKADRQVKRTRKKSPYIASPQEQVRLNVRRSFQRVRNDMASTLTPLIGNSIMALIIGSVFYGTPDASVGFQSKGATLFLAILINALSAIAEINNLYSQRPIVEKHKSYAFYHPWTEAIAGIVLDIPLKFLSSIFFNIPIYFLCGLRREASQFFIFFLIAYITTFCMSAVFRTMAAVTKTVSQAMALSGVLVLAIVVYTGYSIPVKYMHPWFSWIRFINPVYYAFEALVANEFHGRQFPCSQVIPAYPQMSGDTFICSVAGSLPGQYTVSGDEYILKTFTYTYAHEWRNLGILLAFLVGFTTIYALAVELNSSTSSTAEVLVFRRGKVPANLKDNRDEESGDIEKKIDQQEGNDADAIAPQTDIFSWKDVVYDIEIKGEPRRLLDHVSGWVKPGTLTALMGTSGAGKTTLLDALAQRTTMGVITGDMFVNGKPLDRSFQRKTGYVQQQDLHLSTATVRESLRFSAMLRQPKSVTRAEKYEYVESVIKMLGMEEFAEAVVGDPGQGLNVEQRKLLTIGVELAAKPKLLLFLDEPTSGLDSQSSWTICALLRKLADHGQAVLCTIHQPSAILFQQFDRLLFLRKGGQTVYFGDVGPNSRTLLDYFEANGARKCGDDENPAEYMLEVVADQNRDWFDTWKSSTEAQQVYTDLDSINRQQANVQADDDDAAAHAEFAESLTVQVMEVTARVFTQFWRMPSYVLAKFGLAIGAGLFIGFSFYGASISQQGMTNVLYSLFQVASIFSTLVQQIMPLFVTQRSLYEVRERPSKAYSWKAFIIANIIVEWPYQIVAGVLIWVTFYYPVVGIQSSERQILVLLQCITLFLYASTFAHMAVAALPDAQTAASIVTLLFAMTLIFCGVLQAPDALPGFWIFMYRVSPLSYWVGGIALAMLGGRAVQCSEDEFRIFNPPSGQTCAQYLGPYLEKAPGNLLNPSATMDCRYCTLSNADQFLAGVELFWQDRWRDFGLMWVYIAFNVVGAVWLYWFFRVRGASGKKSSSPKTRLSAIAHNFRNVYKTRAKTNKGNVEVF